MPGGAQAGSGDIPANCALDLIYDATLDSSSGGWKIIGLNLAGYQPLDATLTAFAALSLDGTNSYLRATGSDTFVAESATAHKTALALNNVDNTSDAVKNAASATLTNKTLTSPTINGATLSGTFSGNHTVSGIATFSANPILSKANARFLINETGGTAEAGFQLQAAGVNKWAFGKGIFSGGQNFEFYNYTAAQIALTIADGTGDVQALAAPTSLAVNSVGFRGLGAVITNSHNAAYTFVLADAGLGVRHTSGSHIWTIPPESSVAWPDGTVIAILVFDGTTVTVAEGSGVTLNRADGVSGTGSRTITGPALATISKWTTNSWYISGVFT
jgi:hypothetical protein